MLVLGRKNEKNYFINATKTEFTEADLNNMFQTYSVFLEPYYDMMEFMENDEQIVEYPLSKFKETASYKNNINILFKLCLIFW